MSDPAWFNCLWSLWLVYTMGTAGTIVALAVSDRAAEWLTQTQRREDGLAAMCGLSVIMAIVLILMSGFING